MLRTPYFLIDERRLVANLEVIRRVREESGREVGAGAEVLLDVGRVRA